MQCASLSRFRKPKPLNLPKRETHQIERRTRPNDSFSAFSSRVRSGGRKPRTAVCRIVLLFRDENNLRRFPKPLERRSQRVWLLWEPAELETKARKITNKRAPGEEEKCQVIPATEPANGREKVPESPFTKGALFFPFFSSSFSPRSWSTVCERTTVRVRKQAGTEEHQKAVRQWSMVIKESQDFRRSRNSSLQGTRRRFDSGRGVRGNRKQIPEESGLHGGEFHQKSARQWSRVSEERFVVFRNNPGRSCTESKPTAAGGERFGLDAGQRIVVDRRRQSTATASMLSGHPNANCCCVRHPSDFCDFWVNDDRPIDRHSWDESSPEHPVKCT
ncbi:uncharacterized protein LOC129749125 isoform X1 [Uranotaenia lowii]|uniref:uncharacterized protein LOC129743562 isoform X1 n=1 Tax=Uranotaenia lowii TaxID=190385 RepID=UPI00247AAF27|nr:uncharacterized protein LOC129743562 isoform X1 [Uranotaenia lowii]XP_055598171.1 uncharacterized protein LOC129747836 isoform X1 [Uranotaenia lowii]XP_055599985.1 uncharacterized protein LOC129749125 isoform X1 [Uranotaenia lowii]